MFRFLTENGNFFENIWQAIVNFFSKMGSQIDSWLKEVVNFDFRIIELYETFIVPLPEIYKILGAILLLIILILGVVSFIKKALKLFVVLAVIAIIAYVFITFV